MIHVAIIHYHLRTGGVTRVIRNALDSLRNQSVSCVVLSGEPPGEEDADLPVEVVPGLAYDGEQTIDLSPEMLQEELQEAARRRLGQLPDVWHVHNHALGKNCLLPLALHRLAEEGHHLLLQLHDFAEDGRPENYTRLLNFVGQHDQGRLGSLLYPLAPHVHYATLNGRDLAYLRTAGVPEGTCHLLPNMVALQPPADDIPPVTKEGRLYVYATRAIRRKNLGEFLLWSKLGQRGDRFAVTLAPDNPVWQNTYNRWVTFAREIQAPVIFEASTRFPGGFDSLVYHCDLFLTTSVAEGFGMSFLEPWLVDTPVFGRNLPAITRDFAAAGIDLSGLYDRLWVPTVGFEPEEHRTSIVQGLKSLYSAYHRRPSAEACQAAEDAAYQNGMVDFSRLDESFQRQFLRAMQRDRRLVSHLVLPHFLHDFTLDMVAQNHRAIAETYGREACRQNLLRLYGLVASSDEGALEGLNAAGLLDQFLRPADFLLLQT